MCGVGHTHKQRRQWKKEARGSKAPITATEHDRSAKILAWSLINLRVQHILTVVVHPVFEARDVHEGSPTQPSVRVDTRRCRNKNTATVIKGQAIARTAGGPPVRRRGGGWRVGKDGELEGGRRGAPFAVREQRWQDRKSVV